MADNLETEAPLPLTDDELIRFLGLDAADFKNEAHKARFLEKIADKRATYERMYEMTVELQLYEQGLAPKPKGVLVDWDRKKRR